MSDDMANDMRKVRTSNIIFLWGFGNLVSTEELKNRLIDSHSAFREGFDLKMVDKSYAAVVFLDSHSSQNLLEDISSGSVAEGFLSEMISNGLKVAQYEAYKKLCEMGIWETNLADSLDKSFLHLVSNFSLNGGDESSEIYWEKELAIHLNDL